MTTVREKVLDGGATFRFSVPTGAVEKPAETLPRFEVSGLPGARIALRRGFSDDAGLALHVACVEAPSDRWAPGIEDVVFGVATGVAHRAMTERMIIDQWDVKPISLQHQRFDQKLSGRASRDGSSVDLFGKVVLGFEGERHDVVLCTALCDEPRDRGHCAEIVGTTDLEGLVSQPPPSITVRAVLFAAERPWEASALVGVIGLVFVGTILARRPRPKP